MPRANPPCTDGRGDIGGGGHLGLHRHDVKVHQVVEEEVEDAVVCGGEREAARVRSAWRCWCQCVCRLPPNPSKVCNADLSIICYCSFHHQQREQEGHLMSSQPSLQFQPHKITEIDRLQLPLLPINNLWGRKTNDLSSWLLKVKQRLNIVGKNWRNAVTCLFLSSRRSYLCTWGLRWVRGGVFSASRAFCRPVGLRLLAFSSSIAHFLNSIKHFLKNIKVKIILQNDTLRKELLVANGFKHLLKTTLCCRPFVTLNTNNLHWFYWTIVSGSSSVRHSVSTLSVF